MMKGGKSTGAEALVSAVAANIRTLRERAGLSLSELAHTAGIGKSTLSMLESSSANPNIETLWALSAALGVPFGELIEPREPAVRVVRAGEGLRVDAHHASFRASLLVSGRSGRNRFELYHVAGEPGPPHQAAAHIAGTTEHLYLIAGRMRVGPEDAAVELAPGDLASFAADGRHVYETLKRGTRALVVMEYR